MSSEQVSKLFTVVGYSRVAAQWVRSQELAAKACRLELPACHTYLVVKAACAKLADGKFSCGMIAPSSAAVNGTASVPEGAEVALCTGPAAAAAADTGGVAGTALLDAGRIYCVGTNPRALLSFATWTRVHPVGPSSW